jgi:hypothetical protein
MIWCSIKMLCMRFEDSSGHLFIHMAISPSALSSLSPTQASCWSTSADWRVGRERISTYRPYGCIHTFKSRPYGPMTKSSWSANTGDWRVGRDQPVYIDHMARRTRPMYGELWSWVR